MKYYISFGNKYKQKRHPYNDKYPQYEYRIDPDGLVEIEADSLDEAYAIAVSTFDNDFCAIYDKSILEKDSFPFGIIFTINKEGVPQ